MLRAAMRTLLLLIAVVPVLAPLACGHEEPPVIVNSPMPSASTKHVQHNEADRILSVSECKELADYISDCCHEPTNFDRSGTSENWCHEFTHRQTDDEEGRGPAWESNECSKHFKVSDEMCFKTNTAIKGLIECDHLVDRR
jgi:hypothetical protein